MDRDSAQQDHPASSTTHPLEELVDVSASLAGEFTGRPGMSEADIEDATAHAVNEARKALANGTSIKYPRAWMRTVAERFHARQIEKREMESLTDDVDRSSVLAHDPRQLPEGMLDLREGTRLALNLLAELPPLQREAMTLHALGGLRVVDVARQLGVPARTAQKRVDRARAKLLAMGRERLNVALGLSDEIQTTNDRIHQGGDRQ